MSFLSDRWRPYAIGRSASGHDRIFKAHVIEQAFDRSALRIGAAEPDIPIAMGMRLRVAHDDFAKRPAPCLGRAPSFPDEARYKQIFEVRCRHRHRLAVAGG
ncbi:hypothetical protein MTR62_16110 [Novosphingobium sp. 1949]|uniref:Uncharacterized protein n=1 Tax=Novosphingobium organovorum TaxID=2930092 RepID=A0ABT0BGP2_9SPHN|nr:hypothetical protein [Novosphingobium organovorum]MCJ2184204.1 hypothetical protein [Novosphingobium organovorum]